MNSTRTVKTYCKICIASCGIELTIEGDRVAGVKGDNSHPVSKGYTCPKGRAIAEVHHDPRRLDGPLLRRDGTLVAAQWAEVLSDLDGRLHRIIDRHGPSSMAFFFGGGSYLDAAGHWATKRFINALPTPNVYSDSTVDSAAKWRVAELMAGTASLLPHPDDDPRMLLLIGTNPIVSHGQTTSYPNPVERLRQAKASGELWVIDPRSTESARMADHHLAARPGTDHQVLGFLVRSLLDDGVDLDALALRADGIAELRAAVDAFDRDSVAVAAGLEPAELDALLASVRKAGRLAIMTGTGTTMSPAGNLVEWMAWALLVITESFDRPGGMWFNPGYMAQLERRPALPRSTSGPGAPSRTDIGSVLGEWPAALIIDEIEAGRIKALFAMGSNLLTTLPDTERLERALRSLDVLVCFDVITNPTTALASHVMACRGQLERADVPMLNDVFAAEVYTQYGPRVFEPIAERRPAWWIVNEIATRLGRTVLPEGIDASTADDDDLLQLVMPRVALAELKAADGAVVRPVERFGWAESKLGDGVWHLAPTPLVQQLATFPARPPLALIPRRQVRKMNAREYGDREGPVLLIHPDDAVPAGLVDGAAVEVASATGTLVATARITESIRPGAVSLPHGWSGTNVNVLISARDIDPLTGMALMSGTAVTLRAVTADPEPAGASGGSR